MLGNEDVPSSVDKGVLALFDNQDKKKEESAAKEAARILTSFDDDFTFTSYGYTQPIKLTRGDKVEYIKLPIKSVGVADVIEQTEKDAPRPPTVLRKYKRGSDEARQWGYTFDFQVREQDVSDPKYVDDLAAHNRKSGQFIILSALMDDWYSGPKRTGELILKGSDPNTPTEILDRDKCLARLRRMGMSGGQYAQILRDVRGLTEDIEEQEKNE